MGEAKLSTSQLKPGSIWRRWDPHIHAPGTVFNDQFRGEDPWEGYLARIEQSSPRIEALGITDYFSLDIYEEVCAWKNAGRLPDVSLIFPNIELRYAIGTNKGSPVNFHLLISPEDPEHVLQARRFLDRLTFKSGTETYRCRSDELTRLGRKYTNQSDLEEKAARREGARQFKIEVDPFIEAWNDDSWIQSNALIAISANSKDGSAGLQGDTSLTALRRKIERIAHIVFSSQPKQREFWLGQGADTLDKLKEKYGGPKPCLHGSDAHDLDKVGKPSKQRYCWIKGDPCFDALRQTCLEPEFRVAISESKPQGAFASQTITSISMENADWFGQEPVLLNGGLVGVIGARGSGKTALADMIAAGAYALSPHADDRSFVRRAQADRLLADAQSTLKWADGSTTSNGLDDIGIEDILDHPRVQYLSQQFVERLCSATGATDELVGEIERVVFMSHPQENRLGAEDFNELLSLVATRGRESRQRFEESIQGIGQRITEQLEKKALLPGQQAKLKELGAALEKDQRERATLVPKGAEQRATAFENVSSAANAVRQQIELVRRRQQAIAVLTDTVSDYRGRAADEALRELRTRHRDVWFDDQQWANFKTDFVGDVDRTLADAGAKLTAMLRQLEGDTPSPSTDTNPELSPQQTSFLPKGQELTKLPLSLLEKEEGRLQRLIGTDADKQKRHRVLTEKIRQTEIQIKNLKKAIEEGQGADQAMKTLVDQRGNGYTGVFRGILAEEEALRELYNPLSDRLRQADGALGKLTFSVKRKIDVEEWARRGVELIDTRRAGDLKGREKLLEAAQRDLAPAWQRGTAEEVSAAMTAFRQKYDQSIVDGAKANRTNRAAWFAWRANISEWLYSTQHISLTYGMRYEGVDIETLSPGTRGIVLLLLYLAIDLEDDRPLVIDQPEENLDPKSIFDELVGLFRQAKQRRQIIIVTHNANLIVNTDADQVIVAKCGALQSGRLPDITYTSGALEDPAIRKQVCDILEGGEQAFRQRAERLGVSLRMLS